MKNMDMTVHFQLQQFINLFILLCLGKYAANIYLSWQNIFLVFFSTLLIEHIIIYIDKKKIDYISFSSLSTAAGVVLMMVAPYLYLYVAVIVLGLVQKHFLIYKGRHFFNPSNFALIMGLLLFYHKVHIVLGQLSDSIWLQLLVAVLGAAILYRVERWIIPLCFSLFYLLFQYYLIVHYDPVMIFEDIYYRFYSVSFIVFILFMLTDPQTTPSAVWQQIFFAFLVALFAVWLDRLNGFRVQHLFMALFAVSPLVPVSSLWQKLENKKAIFATVIVIVLALSAIIQIEMQPPYYFEMDG